MNKMDVATLNKARDAMKGVLEWLSPAAKMLRDGQAPAFDDVKDRIIATADDLQQSILSIDSLLLIYDALQQPRVSYVEPAESEEGK